MPIRVEPDDIVKGSDTLFVRRLGQTTNVVLGIDADSGGIKWDIRIARNLLTVQPAEVNDYQLEDTSTLNRATGIPIDGPDDEDEELGIDWRTGEEFSRDRPVIMVMPPADLFRSSQIPLSDDAVLYTNTTSESELWIEIDDNGWEISDWEERWTLVSVQHYDEPLRMLNLVGATNSTVHLGETEQSLTPFWRSASTNYKTVIWSINTTDGSVQWELRGDALELHIAHDSYTIISEWSRDEVSIRAVDSKLGTTIWSKHRRAFDAYEYVDAMTGALTPLSSSPRSSHWTASIEAMGPITTSDDTAFHLLVPTNNQPDSCGDISLDEHQDPLYKSEPKSFVVKQQCNWKGSLRLSEPEQEPHFLDNNSFFDEYTFDPLYSDKRHGTTDTLDITGMQSSENLVSFLIRRSSDTSLIAYSGATGECRWRRTWQGEHVDAFGDSASDDRLIHHYLEDKSNSSEKRPKSFVQRLSSNGSITWSLQFEHYLEFHLSSDGTYAIEKLPNFDAIHAIDTASGSILWTRHFPSILSFSSTGDISCITSQTITGNRRSYLVSKHTGLDLWRIEGDVHSISAAGDVVIFFLYHTCFLLSASGQIKTIIENTDLPIEWISFPDADNTRGLRTILPSTFGTHKTDNQLPYAINLGSASTILDKLEFEHYAVAPPKLLIDEFLREWIHESPSDCEYLSYWLNHTLGKMPTHVGALCLQAKALELAIIDGGPRDYVSSLNSILSSPLPIEFSEIWSLFSSTFDEIPEDASTLEVNIRFMRALERLSEEADLLQNAHSLLSRESPIDRPRLLAVHDRLIALQDDIKPILSQFSEADSRLWRARLQPDFRNAENAYSVDVAYWSWDSIKSELALVSDARRYPSFVALALIAAWIKSTDEISLLDRADTAARYLATDGWHIVEESDERDLASLSASGGGRAFARFRRLRSRLARAIENSLAGTGSTEGCWQFLQAMAEGILEVDGQRWADIAEQTWDDGNPTETDLIVRYGTSVSDSSAHEPPPKLSRLIARAAEFSCLPDLERLHLERFLVSAWRDPLVDVMQLAPAFERLHKVLVDSSTAKKLPDQDLGLLRWARVAHGIPNVASIYAPIVAGWNWNQILSELQSVLFDAPEPHQATLGLLTAWIESAPEKMVTDHVEEIAGWLDQNSGWITADASPQELRSFLVGLKLSVGSVSIPSIAGIALSVLDEESTDLEAENLFALYNDGIHEADDILDAVSRALVVRKEVRQSARVIVETLPEDLKPAILARLLDEVEFHSAADCVNWFSTFSPSEHLSLSWEKLIASSEMAISMFSPLWRNTRGKVLVQTIINTMIARCIADLGAGSRIHGRTLECITAGAWLGWVGIYASECLIAERQEFAEEAFRSLMLLPFERSPMVSLEALSALAELPGTVLNPNNSLRAFVELYSVLQRYRELRGNVQPWPLGDDIEALWEVFSPEVSARRALMLATVAHMLRIQRFPVFEVAPAVGALAETEARALRIAGFEERAVSVMPRSRIKRLLEYSDVKVSKDSMEDERAFLQRNQYGYERITAEFFRMRKPKHGRAII